jgi:hypothetical protein
VHHRTIQINYQPDATVFQFIILTFVYSSTCFGRFLAHHQELNDCSGSLWFYLCIVVIVVPCSWSGRPWTQHDCHHAPKVKPEAATAVIELLTMGGKMPETCWALNKCQDNKLENCCIWLLIYLNCSSVSIAMGIIQLGVKTYCVYHFILWHFGPFLPCDASYHIAPNTGTIIYHDTNVTDKDLIQFNVTMETCSCNEKPAAAIEGHLTEDVTLQINRPLVCCDCLWLHAQLGWTNYHPLSLLKSHPQTVQSFAD